MRTDLPTEYQIVQAAHVALEAGNEFDQSGQTSFMVLLEAKDESKLQDVAHYLDSKNIRYKMFYEPDYNTGYTAICTEPVFGEQRKVFKRFQTLKHRK